MSTNPSPPDLPPGTSLVPGIEKSFGLVLISIIIASFLMGILALQTYSYYSLFPGDPLYYKIAIALVAYVYLLISLQSSLTHFASILNLAHFVSAVEFTWWYLIRNWGNVEAIQFVRPSYGLTVVFGSVLIFLIQLLFMKRIFNLDKRLIYFIIPMILLICMEFAFGILGATYGLKTVTFESLASPNPWAQAVVGIWLGSGVVVDIGIASVLSFSLHFKRTGYKKTDSIITKLILYTINTCVLTSVAAVLDLITFYKQDVAGEALFICYMALCGLFSNSLLASLNRRAAFRSEVQGGTPGAVSTGLVIQHDSMSPSHTFESSEYNSNSQLSPQTTILPTPITPTPGSRGHWDVEMRVVSPHDHDRDHHDHDDDEHENYSDKHNHRKSFA